MILSPTRPADPLPRGGSAGLSLSPTVQVVGRVMHAAGVLFCRHRKGDAARY